jgi:amino acid transporter
MTVVDENKMKRKAKVAKKQKVNYIGYYSIIIPIIFAILLLYFLTPHFQRFGHVRKILKQIS